MKSMLSFSTVLLAILILTSACATSPTGRKQLLLMPDDQMAQMGTQAFDEMKKTQKIDTDPAINTYVTCVAKAITDVVDDQQWEIVVFKDDQVNAFALPGGKIGVYSGLLKYAKTPGQLGAVLGHETGHVIAKHGNERVSESLVYDKPVEMLTQALEPKNKDHGILVAALGLGPLALKYGVTLRHSRNEEAEADLIGEKLMAKAGFDPQESVTLWQNMTAIGGQPPQILSDHPSDENRIAALQKNMPDAEAVYKISVRHPNCVAPAVTK